MKKSTIIIFVLVSCISCCKEIDYGYDTLIGNWEINFIDSCQLPGIADDPFIHLKQLSYSGNLKLDSDSSGMLKINGGSITVNSDSAFFWSHDRKNNLVDFSFASGTTVGVIVNNSTDNLEICIRDYNFPPPPFPNIKPFYYLNLKRSK